MPYNEFNVRIRMTNSEMKDAEHVAAALEELASDLRSGGFRLSTSHRIADVNGNEVGRAKLTAVAPNKRPNFYTQTTRIDGVEARKVVVEIASHLGGNSEWSGADDLEAIASIIDRATSTLPVVGGGDDDAHRAWAEVAVELGNEHDYDFDDEDDEEDDGE